MIDTVQKAALILALVNMALDKLTNAESEEDLFLQKSLLEIKKDCLYVLKGTTALEIKELQAP